MRYILNRLKELEREQPQRVSVLYPDGKTIDVNALKAFNMAANCGENISFIVDNKAIATLLKAVRKAAAGGRDND